MSFSIEILQMKDNKLLNRKELLLNLTHPKDATPKKDDIANKLATLHQASAKNIVVYNLTGRFGSHATKAMAKIYPSFQQLETVERTFIVTRKTGVKPKKIVRRMRKDARKKKEKMFGSLKRNIKKAEKKAKK